jgi:tetratricopeptide (TPR) repeat protein
MIGDTIANSLSARPLKKQNHKWFYRFGPVILIIFVAFGSYAGTLEHQLVWDDLDLVKFVRDSVEESGLPALLTARLLNVEGLNASVDFYRPVVFLSLAADILVSDHIFPVYHLTNVVLHNLNSILVFILLLRILPEMRGALFGAVIFAAHPVHTESVAWVSGRADLLATFFILLSTIQWMVSKNLTSKHRILWVAGSLITFVLGCLSKEVAFVLPGVLLIWDAMASKNFRTFMKSWFTKDWVWLAGWVLALAAVLIFRWKIVGLELGATNIYETPFAQAILDPSLVLQIWLFYFQLLLMPLNLNSWYLSSAIVPSWSTVVGNALFLGLLLCPVLYRQGRISVRSLAWILGFLLPVSGIIPFKGSIVAERYLYLPSFGLSVLLGYLFLQLPTKRLFHKYLTALLVVLLVSILGVGTARRSGIWQDETTLFSDIAAKSPNSMVGNYLLAINYLDRGMQEEALINFQKALKIRPDSSRKAIWWDPEYLPSYYRLGFLYALTGNWKEAVENLQVGLRIVPNLFPENADLYFRLGLSLINLGRNLEAIGALEKAVSIEPGNNILRYHLALSYLKNGHSSLAMREYNVLKERSPTWANRLKKIMG